MMILFVYGLSLSSVKIVVVQVGAIVISIVALAQFLKNILHQLHIVNKDTLQEAIDKVRSTAEFLLVPNKKATEETIRRCFAISFSTTFKFLHPVHYYT